MERISKGAIMPGRDEIPENILDHKAVYGVEFGAPAIVEQMMGDPSRKDENPGVVCIRIKTGPLSETNVGYYPVFSMMAEAFFRGKLQMMYSTKPWAHYGDPDNVVEGNCMTFISEDGIDPLGGTSVMGFGSSGKMARRNKTPRPDGGLKPNTYYYFTYRLPDTPHGIPPHTIAYKGTDDAKHGGEQLIKLMPADIPEEGLDVVRVNLGFGWGTFIPD